MVLTMKDYLSHYGNDYIHKLLKRLFKKKTVVFIGYGLNESEVLEHIIRRGSVQKKLRQRSLFKLQGFYSSQIPLYKYLRMYYQESFGLELLGFRLDDESYAGLDRVVDDWSRRIKVQPRTLSQDAEAIDKVLRNG